MITRYQEIPSLSRKMIEGKDGSEGFNIRFHPETHEPECFNLRKNLESQSHKIFDIQL